MAKKSAGRKSQSPRPPRRRRPAAATDDATVQPSASGAEAAATPTPRQFSIPPELVETILLGPADDRRVLQDSPLLGDVWAAYAADPGRPQDLLITPHKDATAADVALRVSKAVKDIHPKARPKIAYLQGLVAAKLTFEEVLRVVVPLTQWWFQPQVQGRIGGTAPEVLTQLLDLDAGKPRGDAAALTITSLDRYIALAGLIYWTERQPRPQDFDDPATPLDKRPKLEIAQALRLYKNHIPEIISGMVELYETVQAASQATAAKAPSDPEDDPDSNPGLIFQVSLNRKAELALDRSVPSVKADAVHALFRVKCKSIIWAVLDSGIDGTHPAFQVALNKPKPGEPPIPSSRVRKTFDFSKIREIVSNDIDDLDDVECQELAAATGRPKAEVVKYLKKVATDAGAGKPIDWGIVEKLITLKQPAPPPASSHGTHVAGILGADKTGGELPEGGGLADGMCPDIRLYDFRVLGKSLEDTEFAIIAALQYIRYVNERHNYIIIHGANLSLSIPHNVRNYACGRTPVCNECERLVDSGVVVVAAAGNRGFQKFETNEGIFENYAAFSITDPGNGDGVITVGSTHGNWPQTYGVSFFSSRGPTGDGRLKPDLVAPGERVQSTVLDHGWGAESGTSMAAPHVSGAAAMLLARYEELIGQPRRVKRILCDSATDLGREKTFQGHGMLDVLRAFQSI
ncbi:S8 family peptidase [Rhodopseudomonas palustris]|uniref:Peptidase S8 and S53, subtilisin, kexin, sedolisin n=1 Tax=Rhodopseudomonas palustris (strain BisB18) TaxID=316056 RepID=Q217T5_RHOPB